MEDVLNSNRLDDIISISTACCIVTISILFFYFINIFVKSFCTPKHISIKGVKEEWKWRNIVLSFVHASIVGTWDISCFYYYPELLEDLIFHIKPYTYYLLLVSTGYFLYDFADLIANKSVFSMWELTLHHIAVLSTFFYNIVTQRYIGYNCVALLTEVNSIFLHIRKLMQLSGCSFHSPIYRANALVNLVTFVIFRGYALTRITVGMYLDRERIGPGYLSILGVSMFIMDVLNPILFWLLIKNDVLRSMRSRRRKPDTAKATEVYNHNNNINGYVAANGHAKKDS